MKIVVPYVSVADETRSALDRAGRDWDAVFVGDDDEAYWRLLSSLWRSGQDFVVVEHDVVIAEATLDLFEKCPNEWCASGYRYMAMDSYLGLGCTRFRGELTRALPELMDRVAMLNYGNHGPRHWCPLDAQIQFTLRSAGRVVCEHPAVKHLGLWPAHGCTAKPVTAP